VKSPTPKTLLFDIECTPNRGWYFDEKKEYNILDTDQYSFIHSFAYQWEGESKIHVVALPDFSRYKRNKKDDYSLLEVLHGLFDQADIIIGHNGDNFDIKKVNARLIYHRFEPPAPYKTADTLKLARQIQNSGSNRLDALAKYFGIGAKLANTGKALWLPIAKGEATDKDWRDMRAYNAHDVYLLAKLWPLLRPWGKTPNANVQTRNMGACPACGSHNLILRGHVYTLTTEAQRLKCGACGKWSSDKPERIAKRITIK
jgi:DNA polymerase elongation subunit (family B)